MDNCAGRDGFTQISAKQADNCVERDGFAQISAKTGGLICGGGVGLHNEWRETDGCYVLVLVFDCQKRGGSEGMAELVAECVSRRLSGVGIILFYEKKLPSLRNYGIFAVGLEGSDLNGELC